MNPLVALTSMLGLFGAGRSPAALLNVTAPRSGYRVLRDIAYAPGHRHSLDLYLPAQASRGAPVVVFFYGGGFRAGRKSEYRFVGEALAGRGAIVAVPDYRIFPEARFPDFLNDGAMAIEKTREIAAPHGGDAAKLFIGGHSAGAYIAVMLASNPAFCEPSWIRGVIALSGRYRFTPMRDETINIIFGAHSLTETRPSGYIKGPVAPMLLAAGSAEAAAVLDEKARLAAHLREHGSEVEEVVYPGVGHVGIIAALAPGFRRRASVREDILRFIASH